MDKYFKNKNMLMRVITNTNNHIWVSLILFGTSLILPAYYIKETHEPTLSMAHLLLGWLGLLAGYYAWLANPIFLIAVIKFQKPRTSYTLGVVALCLALSFLLHDKIITSEAPTYATITAYGWGYFLWVLSMIVFTAGQYSLTKNRNSKSKLASISVWSISAISVFCLHYFIGENSQFEIEVNRDRIFKEKCLVSGEKVLRKVNDVKGIYFNSYGGGNYEMFEDGSWHHTGGGISGMQILSNGSILFYETKNHHTNETYKGYNKAFRKYVLNDHLGVATDHLESNYAVLISKFDIPKSLNIVAEKITVTDLTNNSVLAEAVYTYDPIDKRFCGNAKKRNGISYKSVMNYSAFNMVYDVLGLAKNRGRYLATEK
jgi:hypothetical protein